MTNGPPAESPRPRHRHADNVPETDPRSPAPVPEMTSSAANPLRRTRASVAWVGVIVFAVVMVLLLIFILQNTQEVRISYFGAAGQLPLAVAMLLAAVAGVVLTAIAGTLRIWQLRKRLRR